MNDEFAHSLFLSGLLFGAAWMHDLRRVVFPDDPESRRIIALAGYVLYWVAALCCMQPLWAPLRAVGVAVAIVGPVVGLVSVIGTGNRPDEYQIQVGWFQLGTLLMAIAYFVRLWGLQWGFQ